MNTTRIKQLRAWTEKGTGRPDAASVIHECLDEIERLQGNAPTTTTDDDEPVLDDDPLPLVILPPAGPKKKARGTLDEFQAFAKTIGLPSSDGEAMFWKFESTGWKNAGRDVKDWQAVMRQWKAAGYHPSQKTKPNGHAQPQQRSGPVNTMIS